MSEWGLEQHDKLLRAWHLAVLRFALTGDNGDRLGVLAIANEIDRLGQRHRNEPGFSFFRRTSAALCAAMLGRSKGDNDILNRYLAQMEDLRLRGAMCVVLGIPQPKPEPVRKQTGSTFDLWRGLPSRNGSSRL